MTPQHLFLLSCLLYGAGAILSLALRRAGRAGGLLSATCTLAAAIAGLGSAIPVLLRGEAYASTVPGWVPFGAILFEVDGLAAFMLVAISLLAAATAVCSLGAGQGGGRSGGAVGFFENAFILSMALVVATANLFYFLVFWEIMTLASYFLVVHKQDEEGIGAGLLYFAVAHAAAAALIAAFAILYLQAGSFDFAALRAATLPPTARSLVFWLCFIGFGAKAGIVPLHFWLPRAYAAAPPTTAALLSAKVAIYGLIRMGVDLLCASAWWWGLGVLAFGALSAVVGALYASSENDLGRMLGYSSVENAGIMLMGIGVGMAGIAGGDQGLAVLGFAAGLYHLLNHALFKGTLFLGAGSVIARTGTSSMERMGGLARQMPWSGAAFLVAALSAAAIPPFNGFVSEWLTYQSLFQAGDSSIPAVRMLAPLAMVVLAIAGALAALCFVRAYGAVFTGPARTACRTEAREAPGGMVAGTLLLAVLSIGLGIGAPVVAPHLSGVAAALVKSAPVSLGDGLMLLSAGEPQAVISMPLIALLLLGFVAVPLILPALFGRAQVGRRIDAEPWSAGYQYSTRMAYTASAFSQPLRVLFRPFYLARTGGQRAVASLDAWFRWAVNALDRVDPLWERYLYGPVASGATWFGGQVQRLAHGNVRIYCVYIIATLVALLLATAR